MTSCLLRRKDLEYMTEQMRKLMQQCLTDTPARRAKLFGLASLRAIDDFQVVVRVMSKGTSIRSVTQALRLLYTDWASIFTDTTNRYLQTEIRDVLRRCLLEQLHEKEVYCLILSILNNQRQRLHELEQDQTYLDLRARFRDETWIETFLDFLEAQLWVDPSIGVTYAIPFMLGASLFHPHLIHDVANTCAFFAHKITAPQLEHWFDICRGFTLLGHEPQPQEKLSAIARVQTKMKSEASFIPSLFESYHQQLFAALHWRMGELYRDLNMPMEASEHYLQALPALYSKEQLPVYTARLYRVLADETPDSSLFTKIDFLHKAIEHQPDSEDTYRLLGDLYFDQQEYRVAMTYYQYAVELQPYDFEVWINLGVIHTLLKEYPRALDELNYAEKFDRGCAELYFARGNVYRELRAYAEALNDFSHVISLDPNHARAYTNRGNIYAMLNLPEQASQDYEQTIQIQPDDMQALWLREWMRFGKQRVTQTKDVVDRLLNIADAHPEHYLAAVCKGLAQGLTQKRIKEALPELERGCQEAPDQWDAYFWLAMVAAYCNYTAQAEAALCTAIELGLPTALLLPLYW